MRLKFKIFFPLGLQNVPLSDEREPKKGLFRTNSVTVSQNRSSRERHTAAKVIPDYWLKILQKDRFQFPAGFLDADRIALVHQWFTWCSRGCTKMTSSPSRRPKSVALNFDELVFTLFSTEINNHNEALKRSATNESSNEVEAEKIENMIEIKKFETLNLEGESSSHNDDESLEIQLILSSHRIHHIEEEEGEDEPSKGSPQMSQEVLAPKSPPKPRPRTIFLSDVEIQESAHKAQEVAEVPMIG